jgi:translation initiation factor 3 subunit M
MTKTDAVAIFAEGTFEDQVRALSAVHCGLIQGKVQIAELAGYISLSRPEPERAPYVQSIREKLTVEEGETPLSEDVSRRREVFSIVFGDVKKLGEGTDRGACQSFLP